jgi:hypothetical protein
MDHATDIRAHIDADAVLQAEINRALLAIADSMSQGSDLRLVRILVRMLEASWAEHVTFQDEVVFPIVLGRHTRGVAPIVGRLRSDHVRICECNSDICKRFDRLLREQPNDPVELEAAVRAAFERRRDHMHVSAELTGWLPATFSAAEASLYCVWETGRPTPRFPLNLLKGTGQRAFRFGGRPH